MIFEVVDDKRILDWVNRDSPELAGDYVKNKVTGFAHNSLSGLDLNKLKLRVKKISYDYYDLDGKMIEPFWF